MFLLAANTFAQSQATTGNIEGRVTDSNGAAVSNVSVSATNQDNGFGKTTVTSEDGNFVFVLLPPGTYKVETAAVQGFAASTYENVKVTVGAKNTLEIVNAIRAEARGRGKLVLAQVLKVSRMKYTIRLGKIIYQSF